VTQTSGKNQIWTMKLDGTEQRKLIDEKKDVTSPRWAPSGDAIYYLRAEGDTTDLVKLPVSGPSTETSVLVNGLETGGFTLSADGSQLAYNRTQDYSNLWLSELPLTGATAKAHVKPLTFGTLSYYEPSISPDGHWVAFGSGSSTKANIYKMSVDGGQPMQLTFFDDASSPAWSPDGQRIAFICDRGGTPKVWVVNANGGTARPLDKTDAANTNEILAWFPSSEILYQQTGLHNLHRVNVETQKQEPVLPADVEGWLPFRPSPSPDGKKIAIYWNRRDQPGLFVITLDKGSKRLVYPGDYLPIGWSPSGDFIYSIKGVFGKEIVAVALEDSKQPRSIITMPGFSQEGTVSPDGRKIIANVREIKSDVWLMTNFDPQATRAKQPPD
jgi:Tol biopolymer transport system component